MPVAQRAASIWEQRPSSTRRFARWLLGIALVLAALWLFHLITRTTATGREAFPVHVHIIDAATGKPIAGAAILAFDHDHELIRINPPTQTDASGDALVSIFAVYSQDGSELLDTAAADADGARVQCSAFGYVTQETVIAQPVWFGRILGIPFGSRQLEARVPMRPLTAMSVEAQH